MKRFLFLIGIALIVVSCNSGKNQSATRTSDSSSSTKTPSAQQPPELTLNGYNKVDAESMVLYFLKHKGIYDENSKTDIWFSKHYIDSLDTILHQEHADGIRIYFARGIDKKLNIVMVSTRAVGTDHQDFFTHATPFVNFLKNAKGEIDYVGDTTKGVLMRCHSGALGQRGSCPTVETCNISNKHYIECQKQYKWAQNYTKDPKNNIDTINTTSIFYERSYIDTLVEELKTKVSQPKSMIPDGVRIYLARKSEKEKTSGQYRHTFLFMTTKMDPKNSKNHIDYIECNRSHNKNGFVTLKEQMSLLAESILSGSDNGEQCRDQCNGITWSDQKTAL